MIYITIFLFVQYFIELASYIMMCALCEYFVKVYIFVLYTPHNYETTQKQKNLQSIQYAYMRGGADFGIAI